MAERLLEIGHLRPQDLPGRAMISDSLAAPVETMAERFGVAALGTVHGGRHAKEAQPDAEDDRRPRQRRRDRRGPRPDDRFRRQSLHPCPFLRARRADRVQGEHPGNVDLSRHHGDRGAGAGRQSLPVGRDHLSPERRRSAGAGAAGQSRQSSREWTLRLPGSAQRRRRPRSASGPRFAAAELRRTKPFCDGSHKRLPSSRPANPTPGNSQPLEARDGELAIEPQKDGPLVVSGNLEICSGTGRTIDRVSGRGFAAAAVRGQSPSATTRMRGSASSRGSAAGCPGSVHKSGAGHPRLRQAAVSVFAMSIAMVIGPTPPGTGVIAAATAAASSKATSPDQSRLALASLGRRNAIDADIDHRRAGLDPVATNHFRPANRCHHDIGPADDVREIAGLRMGDGHRAVRVEEELGHRLADKD